MLRLLLTPRWLALTALLAVVVLAFGWLGEWQVDRAREQRARAAAASAPTGRALPLESLYPAGEQVPADAVGRAGTVAGEYDAARQRLVPGRRLDGRTGAWVLVPLVTAQGVAVPVVRGWVAPGQSAPAPVGQVRVTGVVEPSEGARDAAVADAGGPAGTVPYVGSGLLLSAWGYPADRLQQGWLRLTAEDPSTDLSPRLLPTQTSAEERIGVWRHVSYAAQWWVFAAAALVFWASALRSRARDPLAAVRLRSAEPPGLVRPGGDAPRG